MDDIPAHFKKPIDRDTRCSVILFAVGILCLTVGWVAGYLILLSVALAALLTLMFFITRIAYRFYRLPEKIKQFRIQEARRAEDAEKRAIIADQRREQARERSIQQKAERQARFFEVEDLAPGERTILETGYGQIWVTKCIDGTTRLWWQFNSSICSLAVPLVKGRARYVSDPAGWFIYRGREREVLAALANLD